ncbi:MAG: hypothetical protein ACRDLT_16335 [Solirubrobacteraceae bacterium]
MTDSRKRLEQRCRWLLSLYPKTFREARREEMLTTLMDASEQDQKRPRTDEALSLVGHALTMQTLHSEIPDRHPFSLLAFRAILAVWISVATVILCSVGYWVWGAVVFAFFPLNAYLANRIVRRSIKPDRTS